MHFREALRLQPDDATAYQNLGVALGQLKRHDEAADSFRRSTELDPANAGTHAALAEELTLSGKPADAILCARKAIELDAKTPAAHMALGDALRAHGEPAEAVTAYRTAIALAPDVAERYNNLGGVLHETGNLDEATACFRRAIELNPKLPQPHGGLASLLFGQGKLDEAAASCRTAVDLDPKGARARGLLGNILRAQGKVDEAIASYRQAIEVDPKHVAAHSNLANVLATQGKHDEAAALYRAVLAIDPKNAVAHLGLGRTFAQQGQLEAAIAEYRLVIDAKPQFAPGQLALGIALARHGKPAEAEPVLREAVRLAPSDAAAHSWLGLVLEQRGEKSGAEAEFREALRLKPDDAFAQDKLREVLQRSLATPDPSADVAARLASAQEAVELLKQFVAHQPTSSWHWQTLGWAHYRAGEWQASVDALEKSIELQESPKGGDPWQWFFLAMAHWQLGNNDEATRWYEQSARWTETSGNEQSIRFRAEAAALLGVALPTWTDTWARELAAAEEAVATRGDAKAFDDRARLRARHGEFREASADFLKAIELDPAPHLPWYQGGSLLAYLDGDDTPFGEYCRTMLARFSDTADRNVAERTAKLLSSVPPDVSGIDPKLALELAERAVADDSPHPDLQWFQTVLGMAEYRAGRFEAAVALLTKDESPVPHVRTELAALYEAMARHRLGQSDAATELLRGAVERMETNHPKAGRDDLTADGFHDFLFCLLARREAETLIGGTGNAAVTK